MHQGLCCNHHRHLCLYVCLCLCLFLCHFLFLCLCLFLCLSHREETKCIKVIKNTFSKAHIITFQKRKALFSNCRPTSLAVENPKLPSGKQGELVKATKAKHTLSRKVKTFPSLTRPKTHFEEKKKQGTHALEIFQDMMTHVRPGKLPRGEGSKEAAAAAETFPTPMEEPRKVIKAWYLGSQQVNAIIIVINIVTFALVLSASPRFQIPVGWIQ